MKPTHRRHERFLAGSTLLPMVLALLAILSGCSTATPGSISALTEITTGMRAVAAMEPDEKVRNPDYLAEEMLPPAFWFYGPFRKDFKTSKDYINFYRISGYYTINARTKHIDAILQRLADQGLKQVVIMGAGLDTRPYRFQKQMPGVRFFEVASPETLTHKKKTVQKALGSIPSEVAYVALDHHTQTIGKPLEKAGYDETQKTLFIWEGDTASLDAETVDGTLQFIAGHSAPGSEVVFDYILEEVARGDFSKYPRARFASVRRKTSGEPWKFGIPDGRAGTFITRRGLELISDYGPVELARQYLIRSDGTLYGQPSGYIRVLNAKVPAQRAEK